MKTRVAILTLALLAACAAFAQEPHPNMPKGFDPDKVYDLNELDQIDLYTGGLRATIPLGSRYQVNGQLSYGFTLVYNSAMWDLYPGEEMFWFPPAEPVFVPYVDSLPDHRSNAGPGWRLSFGKIFPRGPYNTASNYWLYESPDGNDREIGNLDTVGAVTYSRDLTYIRAKRISPTFVTLEFPDGTIHTFQRNASDDKDWRLVEIKDRFENKMWIVYETDGSWTIRDDHQREHKVYFASKNYNNAYGDKLVSRVVLAGFNGSTSEYVFNYQDADYKNSCENDGIHKPENLTRSFLTSLTLPDNSVFQFKYQNSIGTAYTQKCEMGALLSMHLPTGGYVKWDYTLVDLSSDDCGPPGSWIRSAKSVPGVSTRSLLNESQAAEGRVTTYTYAKSPGLSMCGHTESEYTTTTVKTADNGRTVHYFSAWPFLGVSPNGYRVNERGLPFRRLPDGRKLSREFLGSCTSNCTPLRSTYVNYEWEKGTVLPDTRKGLNRRQTYEKVILNEDGNRYIEKNWGNYDGVGHFRVLMTTSDIGGNEARFETTLWDAATGEMKVGADGTILTDVTRPGTWDPWVLNTHYWRSITENNIERVSEFCFDKTTGFMTRARLKGGDGTNDVISVFSHTLPSPFDPAQNGKGNVLREEYYGGDDQEVATGSLICDTTLPSTPKYTIYNQYQFGGRSTSQYKDAPFKTLDLVIDRNTGLIDESRDVAGILTENSYDKFGRLTEAKTNGKATAKITYDTIARPPVTIAQALDPANNAVLTDKRFYYDPWGRVMQSREQMDGGWATVNTTYDVMGRNFTSSLPEFRSTGSHEFFTPAALATTLYDLYGRMTSVTNPDTSKVEYAYQGLRTKTVTQWMATALGQADTPLTKTEEYDHRGRLLKIVEKSGPTSSTAPIGADVSTLYGYDPDGRLLSAKMNASGGVVQHRIFDYDGRGFLKWESHPESGMTAYTYDPRGHMLTKRQGAADSPFDLNIQYDFAERMTLLSSRNPLSPTQFRPVKQFEFGIANLPAPNNKTDWRLGKTIRASRWNYGPMQWDDIYRVDNLYDYIDDAGRLHGRKQKIAKVDEEGTWEEVMKELTMSVTLNLLDKVDEISYPMCVGCGAPSVNPERKPKHHYSKGRLTRIDNVVGSTSDPITYWPNGLRRRLPHQNGMVDTQEVGAMPRPTEISFKTYDRCLNPAFISQPAGGTGPTNLSVSVSGTAPFQYEWYAYPDSGSWYMAGTTQSISVNPAVRTTYTVTVGNACGYENSNDAVVLPSGCEAPTTGGIQAVLQPDGSWILRPAPTARTPRTYQWKRLSDNVIVGTSETLAVGTLSQTTTYAFTVSDSCGSATSNVTITVPLPMSTTGFSATWLPGTGNRLTWPSSSGATGYTIERRAGTEWGTLTSVTGTQYDDTAIQTNTTYAYRVYATNSTSKSGYSNSDVASTFTYTPPVAGDSLTVSTFNTMLDAVNKIRIAAGLPVVTWANILSPNDPLPSPGVLVSSRHILACRARITEALQALGAAPRSYTDPDPLLRSITALHVKEIQDQTK